MTDELDWYKELSFDDATHHLAHWLGYTATVNINILAWTLTARSRR